MMHGTSYIHFFCRVLCPLKSYGEEKGLIPRICETLFHFIDKHGQTRGLQVEAHKCFTFFLKMHWLIHPYKH